MRQLFASAMVAIIALGSLNAKPRHCMLRIHAQANPQDTATFASSVHAQLSGKNVAIEKIPRLSEQDVIAYTPYDRGNGNFGALFQFDDHGRIALDTLSVERRGGFLFIFINGRVISEMQIDKRVSDGKFYIASGLTAADIALMKKDWPLIGKKQR